MSQQANGLFLEHDCNLSLSATPISWPLLGATGLSDLDRQARLSGIGGSDANIILSGNFDSIRRLWMEKRGETEPENLSGVLQVALGNWTEAFNRQWFEKVSGQVVERVNDQAICAVRSWRRCTLDGFVNDVGAIWEAKHTSAFANRDEVLERYMPQLQHNMAVTGAVRIGTDGGIALKPSDRWIISLCAGHHREQHQLGERRFQTTYRLDLIELAKEFARKSPHFAKLAAH